MSLNARHALVLVIAATLAFRLWLSAITPVTADEAYFVLWGRYPEIGYYDHPPMIGWLLSAIVYWSQAPWAVRLPSTLLPLVVALVVRATLAGAPGRDPAIADWAAICVLLVPMNVWNVLITTDTPLVLFSTLSMLVFARARVRDSVAGYLGAGVLLGLAFLSKYFAVLVGVGYLGWALVSRSSGRWRALALVLLAALPFGLLNLYWNLQSCWCNVMFNAINRHDSAGWSWRTPALYGASLLYLAAPLLWYAWRSREPLRVRSALDPQIGVLLAAWIVPFAAFALLSMWTRIGLHWLLAFVAPLVVTLALAGEARALAVSARFFGVLAVLHAMAAVSIALLPLETWRDTRLYSRLVTLTRAPELVARLEPQLGRYQLASDAYSLAALLAYHARRDVPVFGAGSSHARHDDLHTDWRRHDGADLMIVRREPPPAGEWAPYFAQLELQPLELHGTTFHVVLGRGFDYRAYREGVLRTVRDRYYRIPALLPVRACVFCERYFGSSRCVPGAPA